MNMPLTILVPRHAYHQAFVFKLTVKRKSRRRTLK